MIGCVAVPPPEPKRIRLENAVFEHGFCACSLVRVKHKPEQLLIISVRSQLYRPSLLHLGPSLRNDFSVVINGVFSAVALQFLLNRITQEHDGMRQFLFIERSIRFERIQEVNLIILKRIFGYACLLLVGWKHLEF